MAAAKLAFGVLFITGALPWLLELDLVMGELLGSGFGCRQRSYPRRCGAAPLESDLF
jgi:hypothetical protein